MRRPGVCDCLLIDGIQNKLPQVLLPWQNTMLLQNLRSAHLMSVCNGGAAMNNHDAVFIWHMQNDVSSMLRLAKGQ